MAGRCDGEGRFNGKGGEGFDAGKTVFSFRCLPHWEGKANGRSFEPTCASNECVFAGSWRDVPYKYAALRVLMQCTTSLKAGMSDRVPLRFPHLSFIQLEPLSGSLCSPPSPWGKAVLSFSALETHFPTLFHTVSALSAPTGHLLGGLTIRGKPAIADLRASPDLYCGEAATTTLNLELIIFSLPSKKEPAFAGSFCISTIYFLLKA